GHTVICLDNFSTGKRENLTEAFTNTAFTLIEGDIRKLFGKRQDPNGAYAAVIPLWVKKMINLEPPVINGDRTYSRDFTYVANVVQDN
ncbi:MAG: NAD-dependent epimerase/dehydratase family protein, partial [Bacteroidales bacterium]|nr:NAD-dependent epimerase/dehydratase family protein [Bacteroidales bacterium]